MKYDFENYRYFGHATSNNPNDILENGLNINQDVYGKQNLQSTSYEIFNEDVSKGEEYLVKNVFSIGTNEYRNYLIIMGFEINEINPNDQKDIIYPENIAGYYDKNIEFIQNEQYEYNEEQIL